MKELKYKCSIPPHEVTMHREQVYVQWLELIRRNTLYLVEDTMYSTFPWEDSDCHR